MIQGELEEAIREVMMAKPFFLEVNDAQVNADHTTIIQLSLGRPPIRAAWFSMETLPLESLLSDSEGIIFRRYLGRFCRFVRIVHEGRQVHQCTILLQADEVTGQPWANCEAADGLSLDSSTACACGTAARLLSSSNPDGPL